MDQQTVVAYTVGAFFDRLAEELSNGNGAPGEQGISWKDGSFLSFLLTMRPFGKPLDPLAAD